MRGPKRYPRKRGPRVKWMRRSREKAKRVTLTMRQGEMEEEEEGKSEVGEIGKGASTQRGASFICKT